MAPTTYEDLADAVLDGFLVPTEAEILDKLKISKTDLKTLKQALGRA